VDDAVHDEPPARFGLEQHAPIPDAQPVAGREVDQPLTSPAMSFASNSTFRSIRRETSGASRLRSRNALGRNSIV
jgi:hypothetical protein